MNLVNVACTFHGISKPHSDEISAKTESRERSCDAMSRTVEGALPTVPRTFGHEDECACARQTGREEEDPCCERNPVAGHDGFSAID